MTIREFSRSPYLPFAAVILFAVAAVLPIAFRGIPGGNDAVQHYEFARQIVDAINEGSVYPLFAAHSNHGFGDVGLRFNPPFAYYVLAVSYLLLGDWFSASILSFFLIFLIGALGVYLWARDIFDRTTAIAAAAVFTFAPFHLNEIYNNFLYAEFAASAVLPFCFLFARRVASGDRGRSWLYLAVSYSALICTHLPLAIIGSLALLIYSLLSAKRDIFSTLPRLAASVIGGLILSSFYWVRMVSEIDWLKHSRPEYFADIWSYKANYLFSISRILDRDSDPLSLWLGDLMLGVMILAIIPFVVLRFRRSKIPKGATPALILFAASAVFATPLSWFVWDNFALLQKVQFPWRMMSIVSVFGSLLAAFGWVECGKVVNGLQHRSATIGLIVILFAFVFLSAFIVKAPHFTSRSEFEQLAQKFSAGETFEGWWPAWASRTAFSHHERVRAGARNVTFDVWAPERRSFEVEAGVPTDISLATFYYPRWSASVNGSPASPSPDPEGLLSLALPAETSHVELRFVESSVVSIAGWISFTAWAILFLIVFVVYLDKYAIWKK